MDTLYTENASLKRTGAVGKVSASGSASVALSSKAKYEMFLSPEENVSMGQGHACRSPRIYNTTAQSEARPRECGLHIANGLGHSLTGR